MSNMAVRCKSKNKNTEITHEIGYACDYVKILTAREMFEELGYKQIKHNVFDEEPKPNEWITQDEPYILYKQENEQAIEEIEFRFYGKNVWFKGYRKDLKHIVPCPINAKELKAINKQIEELGWNNE
jgi:hypothetical protein